MDTLSNIFGNTEQLYVAALAIAYNRVKHHVTPTIKTEVENILNQWFGPVCLP